MTPLLMVLVFLELAVVAVVDVKTAKISNLWALTNLGVGLLLHLVFPTLWPWAWSTLWFALGFVVIGFPLFLLGIMGAGDSKFLGSLFIVIPPTLHYLYFEKLVVATMVVGLTLIIYRVVRNFRELAAFAANRHLKGMLGLIRSRFSYAPVMLLAWLLAGVETWF